MDTAILAVDARGVEADVASIDALAALQLAARRHGWSVELRNASPALLELLELVGLRAVLPTRPAAGAGRRAGRSGRCRGRR